MLSPSSPLAAAFTAPVQRPAYLVEAGFATTRRWSSHGTVTWNGQTWTSTDLDVQNLQVQANTIRSTLILGNADDVAGALALAEGVQDIPMTIYGYDASATGSSDVVLLARAVGATAAVDPMQVTISLRDPIEFQQSPRTYCNAAAGFRTLLPAGTVLRINGQDIKLQRRGG